MPWLTDKIFQQRGHEHLASLLDAVPVRPEVGVLRRRFVHLLNPYGCPPGSEAARVQAITCDSLLRARDFAAQSLDVEFTAVVFPEDRTDLPEMFTRCEELERSVLDIRSFKVPRRLPLLFDVLEKGSVGCKDDDYLVFTNMDIALMPQFYLTASRLIDVGFEAMTITRRQIPKFDVEPSLTPLMYSEPGISHPGFDCFVFPAGFVRHFVRNDACIGQGKVMRGLIYNLMVQARRFLSLKAAHLTFHLGHDRAWSSPEQWDYYRHNLWEAQRTLDKLAENPEMRPELEAHCKRNNYHFRIGGDPDRAWFEMKARKIKKMKAREKKASRRGGKT